MGQRGLVAGGLLLCLGASAHAQDDVSSTSISGSLRLTYFSSSRELNATRDVLAGSGQLQLQHAFSDNQRFELETRVLAEDLRRDAHVQVSAINAYWFAKMGDLDLRLGQQKIRWGKADGINPTDFFTPTDFAVLLPLEDDRYRSVPALRADLHWSDTQSLSLVAELGFTPGRVPQIKPAPLAIRNDEPGSGQLQYGARWLYTGNNLDWSISAFHGFVTQPVLSALPQVTLGPSLVRYFPTINGFGADLARNFNKVGFRAELAYTEVADSNGRQSIGSNWFLVSGIDHSIGDLNLNVQALLRYTPSFRHTLQAAGLEQQLAAAQNAIVYMQQERLTKGMTMRIGFGALNQTLQLELLSVAFFDPGNCLLRPLLSYALSDQRKLRLGAEYYAGPDASIFGSLKRNRTVFLELQQFL